MSDDLDLLRNAAATMDDLFEIGLPDAPGMVFTGGRFGVRPIAGDVLRFSAGAADEDRERSFRRCIGEMVETRAQFVHDRLEAFIGRAVTNEVAAKSMIDSEHAMFEGLLGAEAKSSAWLPSTRLSDSCPSLLPAALCLRDMPGCMSVATSLGCAAARTFDEATTSALLETVERDAVALWWRGGAPAHASDQVAIPGALALLGSARAGKSSRQTRFLDITSDIGIPVVAAVSFDVNGRSIAAGFAARPTFDAACCAAFRELAQMEMGNWLVAMKHERGGDDALADSERRQLHRMRELSADDQRFWQEKNSPGTRTLQSSEPLAIARQLSDLGIETYRVDLTLPDCQIPVVKVVAPLLQAEPGQKATARLTQMRELRGYRDCDVPSDSLI